MAAAGVPLASPQRGAVESLLGVSVIGNLFGWILLVVAMAYGTLWLVGLQTWATTIVVVALGVYVAAVLVPQLVSSAPPHHTGAKEWPAFRKGGMFPGMWSYFSARHVLDCGPLDPAKPYIVQCGPHGIHCWALAAFTDTQGPFNTRYPGVNPVGLAASVMFYIPLVREIFLWAGYRSASRGVVSSLLAARKSVYLCTGGERESLLTVYSKDRLYLSRRKGFVRLALQYGADILPTYAFGACKLYKTSSALHGLRMALVRRLQLAVPLFWGRWFSPIPFKEQLTIVTGQPFKVPQPATPGERPSEALVDEYHAKYIDHVKAMYDQHKAAAGYPTSTLEVC